MKLIPVLALGLLAACQRTPDTPPAPPATAAAPAASLDVQQRLELDVMRVVFGAAVRASAQAPCQVMATVRYALHEKGLRLLSGENIAEGVDG